MSDRFDVHAVRREFLVTKNLLYFAFAHQTPLAKSVKQVLTSFYDEEHEVAGPKPVWLGRVEGSPLLRRKSDHNAVPERSRLQRMSEGLNIAANAIPFEKGDNVLIVYGDHLNNAQAFPNLRSKGVKVRFVPFMTEPADADTFRNTLTSALAPFRYHT